MIRTLLDVFSRLQPLGSREVLRFDRGFRTEVWTGRDLWGRVGAFSRQLQDRGIGRGDRVLLWGANHPAWVIAFWGAVIRGAQVVPIDSGLSGAFIERVRRAVSPQLLIRGPSTRPPPFELPQITYDELLRRRPASPSFETLQPEDAVEIVFTSGTTSSPKGVVLTHRNICSVLEPFDREFRKYRFWQTPFQPIRILTLVPLSHMFGQTMGLFIAALLGGSCVLSPDEPPHRLPALIRRNRISVLVSVPRVLSQLRSAITCQPGVTPGSTPLSGFTGLACKWWKYRRVHRAFGWKFWALVTGGASVPFREEQFWGQLGYLLIQGYGLTEASPVIAVNHPLHTHRGTLGQVLPGQQVRLSDDGEILVKGDNVATAYWTEEGREEITESDRWLHTGDLAEWGESGRLRFKGRKSSLIVTGEGLNVYAEEVEDLLDRQPGIVESAVIGIEVDELTQVHAVLVVDPGTDVPSLMRNVNVRLETHQQIRHWFLWPEPALPRTSSTLKLQRRIIRDAVREHWRSPLHSDQAEPSSDPLASTLRAIRRSGGDAPDDRSPGAPVSPLDLSSLDRLELLSRLETEFRLELDESEFSRLRSAEDLRAWIDSERRNAARPLPGRRRSRNEPRRTARWPRRFPFPGLRTILFSGIVAPLFRRYFPLTVMGTAHLEALSPPLLIAANHTSHLDTIALIAALPKPWRQRLCPAVRSDYFETPPSSRRLHRTLGVAWRRLAYLLGTLFFNIYLVPQHRVGLRAFLEDSGRLAEAGHALLLFPEGRRSRDGRLQPFQEGIASLALALELPVVPVHLSGLFEAMPPHSRWPHSHAVTVALGPALTPSAGESPRALATRIEQAVRRLALL